MFSVTFFIAGQYNIDLLWHITGIIVNDWIKMLDVRIYNKSPPHNIQFFVNIPSIILRSDKYNNIFSGGSNTDRFWISDER